MTTYKDEIDVDGKDTACTITYKTDNRLNAIEVLRVIQKQIEKENEKK